MLLAVLLLATSIAIPVQQDRFRRYVDSLHTEYSAEVERLSDEYDSIEIPEFTPAPTVEEPEISEQACEVSMPVEHDAAYWKDFIETVGPLLEEYPHMLQYTLLMEYADNAGSTPQAAELFNSMLPVPGKE